MKISRRNFLIGAGITAASAATLSLCTLKQKPSVTYPATQKTPPRPGYASWGDLYREKWRWDRVVKGSHNRANCFSACSWNLFVKDGIVWREEQNAVYAQTNSSVPDFNPRGCQKGGCYSNLQQEESRVLYPMKRVGERGEGKWKRISWDEALTEVADACLDAAVESGTTTVVHDHGTTNCDFGPDSGAEMRWSNAFGTTLLDSWAGVGDMPNGLVQTWGMYNADGTTDDWFLSDYIVLWVANPLYTRIPDIHFIHEARYRGAQLVIISPDLSASSIHADLWINVKQETDAAFGLAAANVILEEGLYDKTAVKEQTDLPLLVREDNGRYLRESDLKKGGSDEVFYMWDLKTKKHVQAPGSKGKGARSIALGNIDPALDGRWEIKLSDGKSVSVRPLFQVMRDHLNENYTPKKQEAITGVKASVVEHFARGLAKAPAAMIYASWGACKNYHSDLYQRAMALLMAITGNQGKKGGGFRVAAWWQVQGIDDISASRAYRPELDELVSMAGKAIRGFTPSDWEPIYTSYSNFFGITPLMPFLYVHGGYNNIWDDPLHQDATLPRKTAEYMKEAIEKKWIPIHPEPGNPPKVFIYSGANPLRRWPSPQTAKKYIWKTLKLIVSTNFRWSTSSLWSDIVLPVAAYYEKYGIKYGVSAMPYLVVCEAATPPRGEAKTDWEVFGSLAKRVEERAKERGITKVRGPNGREIDLSKVYEDWSHNGKYDPTNPREAMDIMLRGSDVIGNISADEAFRIGAVPVIKGGNFSLINQTCSDFKPGETFTPYEWYREDKLAWPTVTGRQQFLLDHPWFMEAGENLPVHKDSPGMRSGYPLRLTSGHARWSIHAIQRDQKLMLHLQRGEPTAWMHPDDMAARSLQDHDKIRVYNEHGDFEMRVRPAARMQPGMIQLYHAWEPYQFKNWKGQQEPVAAPWKPLHLAGGYGQLHYRMYYNAPGHNPRGIGVEVEKVVE